MAFVRVVEIAAVRHPETGQYVVPNPTQPYPDDDPIVRAYPWMFRSDNEDDDAPVERAVANPGYKRPVRPLRRDR